MILSWLVGCFSGDGNYWPAGDDREEVMTPILEYGMSPIQLAEYLFPEQK
jgi:hypothetical protein